MSDVRRCAIAASLVFAALCAGCGGSGAGTTDGGEGDGTTGETGASSSGGPAGDDASNAADSPGSDAPASSSGSSSGGSGSSGSSSGGSSSGSGSSSGGSITDGGCDDAESCVAPACCPWPDQTCDRFTATGGTVANSFTNETWDRTFAALSDFPDAAAACKTWGGHLPSVGSITTFVQAHPSCDGMLTWAVAPSGQCVWTSTAYGDGGSHQCVGYGSSAPTAPAANTESHYALCLK